MKAIRSKGFDPARIGWEESIFHTANGYLGVRASLEEGAPENAFTVRGTYINALYDIKDIKYGEKLYGFPETAQGIVNLTDVQTVRLWVDGEFFSLTEGEILKYEREVRMDKGFSQRSITWRSPNGKEVQIRVRRMASLNQRELFILSYRVRPLNFEGEIVLEGEENGNVENFSNPDDPRVSAESPKHLFVQEARRVDDATLIVSTTGRSDLTVACAVKYRLDEAGEATSRVDGERVLTRVTYLAEQDEDVTLTKYCVFTDSRREADPRAAALGILNEAVELDPEYWMIRQQEKLDRFWKESRVTVDGDKKLQASLDYSLYTLFCSAGRDEISNVPAKGLSGEGYEGHYFWDSEIYIFPFFLLTNPDIAKNMLAYRHHILPEAREHAKTMGHEKGALYAWRTISGSECSGYYPSGSAQYHLSGDVAHSFIQYYLATGDIAFMRDKGAEVLVETARLFMDAGHWVDGAFHLDCVTGPDEYTCIVNNNFYTNAAAGQNLLWATKIILDLRKAGMADEVTEKLAITDVELMAFVDAGENMLLPYDSLRGIHAQDDSFLKKTPVDLAYIPEENFPLLMHCHPLWLYRHQVCKQADTVLAHYLFEDLADEDIMRRSYDYYEKCTTHDSSLSTCVFSIMAAKLGDMDKAMDYFRRTATLDLDDTHGNTRDGIHTANMGGVYLGIVAGFGGLRIKEDGLHLSPRLPEKWDGYSFTVKHMGATINIQVRKNRCTLELLNGEPVTVFISGKKVKVKDKTKVDL